MTEERIFEKREKTKFESEKKEMERRWVEQKIENWKQKWLKSCYDTVGLVFARTYNRRHFDADLFFEKKKRKMEKNSKDYFFENSETRAWKNGEEADINTR